MPAAVDAPTQAAAMVLGEVLLDPEVHVTGLVDGWADEVLPPPG